MKFARCLLVPWFLALGACSTFKSGKPDADMQPPTQPPAGPELVGRIASIASERRFVLIQSYGPWKREAGAVLTSRGDEDRVANLLVTGEAAGQFAAADIQSGTVEIGDAVYAPHLPALASAPGAGTVEEGGGEEAASEDAGNVQKNN